MDSQLLIHEMAVPVSAERHGDWSLETATDFGFFANLNAIPLMTVEFFNASSEYVIVFGDTDEGVMPFTLVGLQRGENRYLSASGVWQARYIPAFVRRYPFVYAVFDKAMSFALCVDESYPYFNDEGRGEPLFVQGKKPSPFLGRMLLFLEQHQLEFERTRDFCSTLQEFDLLEPMPSDLMAPGGDAAGLRDLKVVNRDKAKSLASDKLSALAQSDEFGLLQLHLHSLRNFPVLKPGSTGRSPLLEMPVSLTEGDLTGARI